MSNELFNYYAHDTDMDQLTLEEVADVAGYDLDAKDAQIAQLKAEVSELRALLEALKSPGSNV